MAKTDARYIYLTAAIDTQQVLPFISHFVFHYTDKNSCIGTIKLKLQCSCLLNPKEPRVLARDIAGIEKVLSFSFLRSGHNKKDELLASSFYTILSKLYISIP